MMNELKIPAKLVKNDEKALDSTVYHISVDFSAVWKGDLRNTW